jgi:hypothetical protein
MRRSNSPINFVLRPALFSNLKNRREADGCGTNKNPSGAASVGTINSYFGRYASW